jgi:hypothetical protein
MPVPGSQVPTPLSRSHPIVVRFRVSTITCPSSFFSYNPDHFTGRVDGLSDRMHTLNNDGGRDINAVYEFRRLRCDD